MAEPKHKKPVQQLKGCAFITLDASVKVLVSDEVWRPIIGTAILSLPGGVELDVIDKELASVRKRAKAAKVEVDSMSIPMKIHDVYFPPVRVEIPLQILNIKFNKIKPGEGKRAHNEPKLCRHTASQIPGNDCPSCFRRWWRIRARKHGLEV